VKQNWSKKWRKKATKKRKFYGNQNTRSRIKKKIAEQQHTDAKEALEKHIHTILLEVFKRGM